MTNYKHVILSKLNKKSYFDVKAILNRVLGALVAYADSAQREKSDVKQLKQPTILACFRAITSLENVLDFSHEIDPSKAELALREAFDIKDTATNLTFGESLLKRFEFVFDEIKSMKNTKPETVANVKTASEEANGYISNKIKKLVNEGYEQKQAVAIAYEYARKQGYKV